MPEVITEKASHKLHIYWQNEMHRVLAQPWGLYCKNNLKKNWKKPE